MVGVYLNYSEETRNELYYLQKRVADAKDAIRGIIFDNSKASRSMQEEFRKELQIAETALEEYRKEKEKDQQLEQALEDTFKALDDLTNKKEKIVKKFVHHDETGVDLDIDEGIVDGSISNDNNSSNSNDTNKIGPFGSPTHGSFRNVNQYIVCGACNCMVDKDEYDNNVECCFDCILMM